MPDSGDSPKPQPPAAAVSDIVRAREAALADLARVRMSLEHLEEVVAAVPATEDGAANVPSVPASSASAAPKTAPVDASGDEASAERGEATEPSEGAAAAAAAKNAPLYTLGEEIANSITHGIGVLLGIAGLVLLIVKAVSGGAEPTHIASAIVFGCTLILEYLASTLYHAIAAPRAKRVFRIIDHSSIYLLIAGSYTPFCLITLSAVGGIPMFVVVWALAFAGISFEIIGRQRQPRWVTILIYLAMGWLVVFRIRELVGALDPVALALLVVGGLCYTIGTIFYLLKKIRYMHSVWHLWVLAGSIFIFMAVILYVI